MDDEARGIAFVLYVGFMWWLIMRTGRVPLE